MGFLAAPLVLPAMLLAACAPDIGAVNNGNVDINTAAEQAQETVDNYAATTTRPTPSPSAALVVAPVPKPTSRTTQPPPLVPPAPGTPGGLPDDRTPLSEAPFKADSAQVAANVVQTYYALLGEKKYRQAWALWGNGGEDSGLSATAFAAGFDKYSEYHANVGAPGAIDAGMSQRWVTVPVQVYARLRAGTPVYLIGTAQLHRVVAGVGAPPSRQRWHIRQIDLKPAPRR